MHHIMRCLLLITMVLVVSTVRGQEPSPVDTTEKSNWCLSGGILHGGGALLGAELEYLLFGERVGLQAGAGLYAYGMAMNIHLKPTLNSSYVSFVYWHQGIGERYVQSLIGITYMHRAPSGLCLQVGVGEVTDTGPNYAVMDKYFKNGAPDVMLLFSIGVYNLF